VSLGRGNRQLFVFGTLPDGVTLEQARTEFTTISRELARQYPTTNKDLTATVRTVPEPLHRRPPSG
jgi:hypothetical protein